jgi:hypothetical protein
MIKELVTDDTENSGFIFRMKVVSAGRGKIKGVEQVVYQTRWELTGELVECPECGESHSATFYGATPLIRRDRAGRFVQSDLDKFDPEKAIPYEDLTLEQTVKWIEEHLNGDLHPFERIIAEINDIHRDEDDEVPW